MRSIIKVRNTTHKKGAIDFGEMASEVEKRKESHARRSR